MRISRFRTDPERRFLVGRPECLMEIQGCGNCQTCSEVTGAGMNALGDARAFDATIGRVRWHLGITEVRCGRIWSSLSRGTGVAPRYATWNTELRDVFQ